MKSLPISYGKQFESLFLDAGEMLAKDVNEHRFFEVSKKINDAFFGGGPLVPKSFVHLLSISSPKSPTFIAHEMDGRVFITIRKELFWRKVVGYIEGIPVIGSAVAVINALGHFYSMISSYLKLRKEVKELNEIERTTYNVGRGASCHFTSKVFDAAVVYTVHQNGFIGSLLAIIPLVKPIVRIAQGTLYHCKENKGFHQATFLQKTS